VVINRKKVQQLWREEGLRVARKPRRKRGGTTTSPISKADAPNVIWAIDFQFNSIRFVAVWDTREARIDGG
jgi:hypothetical protein